ncbi:MAG TPA: hypothetical protein VHX49_06945 [Candidatus Acidoferrales bacterium]|nr:hypothetical protein [Candidatus Acidoferrales bacterium]
MKVESQGPQLDYMLRVNLRSGRDLPDVLMSELKLRPPNVLATLVVESGEQMSMIRME